LPWYKHLSAFSPCSPNEVDAMKRRPPALGLDAPPSLLARGALFQVRLIVA
jgi:hypothetical protein